MGLERGFFAFGRRFTAREERGALEGLGIGEPPATGSPDGKDGTLGVGLRPVAPAEGEFVGVAV